MNKSISKEIILASGSENKRRLLESIGLPFKVIPSEIDEKQIINSDPLARVQMIAKAKAYAVAENNSGLIIAADTISVYDGKEYHKPTSKKDAKKMLRELSGKIGQAITGICVLDTEVHKEKVSHSIVNMACKELTDKEIDYYVRTKPVTEWAAAYNPLDDLSVQFFRPVGKYVYKIEYYGLPIDVVSDALREIGFEVDLSKFKA